MNSFIRLYSSKKNEIDRFLNSFFINSNNCNNINRKDFNNETLEYQIDYQNPIEMSDIIGTFIDNNDDYKINMWICIDKDILINVTTNNANEIIKYLYERFPY